MDLYMFDLTITGMNFKKFKFFNFVKQTIYFT